MRVSISIACLIAVTSAIKLSHDSSPLSLAQMNKLPQIFKPCDCFKQCPKKDDGKDNEKKPPCPCMVDVTQLATAAAESTTNEVIEDSGVFAALSDVVGEQEAKEIVDDAVTPIVTSAILDNELKANEIAEIAEEVTPEGMMCEEDLVPDQEDVAEQVQTQVEPDFDDIVTIPSGTPLTEEELARATVTEVEAPDGNTVDVIVIPDEGSSPTTQPEEPTTQPEETAETSTDSAPVVVYDTTVEEIPESDDPLTELLQIADGRPLILDFQYDACGPCQEIAPAFEALNNKYGDDAVFRYVDIMKMKNREFSQQQGVTGAPFFKFWVNGEVQGTVAGAFIDKVEDAIANAIALYTPPENDA